MEIRPAQEQAQALRVSNDERNAAVQRVQAAFTEGRFDADELEARLEAAMTAKTRGDLDHALRHLPRPGTSALLEPATSTAPTSAVAHGPVPEATPGERFGGAVAHLLGLPTLMAGPAVLAAVTRSPYVRQHAIEAVNFQITFVGAVVGLVMLAILTMGIAALALPFLFLAWLALSGIGGLAALVGNRFHYPWALRLLKP